MSWIPPPFTTTGYVVLVEFTAAEGIVGRLGPGIVGGITAGGAAR
jgi:hypothetical protein